MQEDQKRLTPRTRPGRDGIPQHDSPIAASGSRDASHGCKQCPDRRRADRPRKRPAPKTWLANLEARAFSRAVSLSTIWALVTGMACIPTVISFKKGSHIEMGRPSRAVYGVTRLAHRVPHGVGCDHRVRGGCTGPGPAEAPGGGAGGSPGEAASLPGLCQTCLLNL